MQRSCLTPTPILPSGAQTTSAPLHPPTRHPRLHLKQPHAHACMHAKRGPKPCAWWLVQARRGSWRLSLATPRAGGAGVWLPSCTRQVSGVRSGDQDPLRKRAESPGGVPECVRRLSAEPLKGCIRGGSGRFWMYHMTSQYCSFTTIDCTVNMCLVPPLLRE